MTSIKRPKLLTETVLEHLRDQIISGHYQLGAVLSERQLAEELQVSKTPVRESLVQLKNEGLVTIIPQRGAFVFTLSAREVVEICEFRMAIEAAALKLAIERNRDALVADTSSIVTQMQEAQARGDTKGYLALDTKFHEAFFTHCDNAYLRDSYARYAGKIAALRTHLAVKPMHTRLSMQEHAALVDIFRAGTDEEIHKVLDAHIGRTRESYSESVDDIAAADAMKSAG